jgi:hypothetical protein
MYMGAVDYIGAENIQTRFFVLLLPLYPQQSWYVLDETADGISGFAIPLHHRSVIYGYLRWWMIVPLLISMVHWWNEREVIYAVICVTIWLLITFVLGRARGESKRRRRILGFATGLCAEPQWTPDDVAQSMLEQLEDRWEKLNLTVDVTNWSEVVKQQEEGYKLAALVFALSSYSLRLGQTKWQGADVRSWQLIEQQWPKWQLEFSGY